MDTQLCISPTAVINRSSYKQASVGKRNLIAYPNHLCLMLVNSCQQNITDL